MLLPKEMSSALAFGRSPSENTGVLTADAYAPLSLHGCRVTVNILHATARVSVAYEYRNNCGSPKNVLGVFPLVPGWTIASMRADSGGGNVFITQPNKESPAAAALPPCRASCIAIPWSVLVGQFVTVQATYFLPIGSSVLVLPKVLLPENIPVQDTAAAWRRAFVIEAKPRLAAGFTLDVQGTFLQPLQKPPTLEGSLAAESSLLGDPRSFKLSAKSESTFTEELKVYFFTPVTSENQLQLHLVHEACRDVAYDQDALAIGATIAPQFSAKHHHNPNCEIIFVIAVGNGISVAEVLTLSESLKTAFRGIPASCNVNAVCVTSASAENDVWLYESSVPMCDDLWGDLIVPFLRKVERFSHTTTTNSGKSESAMKRTFELVRSIMEGTPFVRGLARNIVVITTDGGDAQAEATCRMVEANRHTTSVSCLSLDWPGSADHEHLRTVAAISSGIHRRCPHSHQISDVLLDMLGALIVPTLTQLTIHYEDAQDPTGDGSSAKSIRVCGYENDCIPQIRSGAFAQTVWALAPSSTGKITVKVEGQIGSEQLQYIVSTTGAATAAAEKHSSTRNDILSVNLAHIAAVTSRLRQLLWDCDASERIRLGTFGVPTFRTTFACRDEGGELHDGAAFLAIANPRDLYAAGRGQALHPAQQQQWVHSTSKVRSALTDTPNDVATQQRLVAEAEKVLEQEKARQRSDLEKKRRLQRALADGDEDEDVAAYETALLQIDNIKNIEASVFGRSAQPPTAQDYFRQIVLDMVANVTSPVSVENIVRLQRVDGSLPGQSATVLAALGVSSDVLEHVPAALASNERSRDAWVTMVALARIGNNPIGVLFEKKASAFFAREGIDGHAYEAHAQHVLAAA